VKIIVHALKAAVVVFFVYYVIDRYVEIENLVLAAATMKVMPIIMAATGMFVFRIAQAYQLIVALIPYRIHPHWSSVLKIQLISSFYSFLLPGDILAGGITWHMLSVDTGRRAAVAAVIAYSRLLNIVILFPFALAGIYLEPRLQAVDGHMYVLALGTITAVVCLPFVWKSAARCLEFTIETLTSPLRSGRLNAALKAMWEAIHVCREMPFKYVALLLGLAITSQLINVAIMWLMAQSVQVNLPFSVFLWLRALLAVIQMFPLPLSGTGVREFSLIYLLEKLYGVAAEKAFLLSLMMLLGMALIASIGAYYSLVYKHHAQKVDP
jgi:uncharacterized membrane protein YbhN (UPF0104 family)